MAKRSGLKWTVTPGRGISAPLATRVEAIPVVIFAVGQRGALRWASQAKQSRPWRDRTNAARAGLTGVAERAGVNTVMQVYHQVEYGIFLETGTALMDAYESILPAMREAIPGIEIDARQSVQHVLRGSR